MKKIVFFSIFLFFIILLTWSAFASDKDHVQSGRIRPNIVLIFPDNLGIGEVSSYGGARGVRTPNIDRLADEGMRFTNFNVEYSCVVSRIALLTGRYAVRTGEGYAAGMTLWEVTIAEALQSIGYATALFGKWHVGGYDWEGRREPIHQGFDEWWGIPGTSHTAQFTSFENFDSTRTDIPYIWEGKSGEPSRRVKPYNLETRRTIDREAAERGIAFMERNVKEGKPFFFFYPMTQIHFPTLPHPDFAGTTGAGDIGDAMAAVDHNVCLVLAALERLDIENNTMVIWCADNGAEMRRPWRGSAGPWRGYYNSAMEGGIRAPCLIRWPGRIPAGQVSNDVVHEIDLFPTIAAAVGAPEIIPDDRIIDGVNQLPFLEGKQVHSSRDSVIFLAREGHVMAVKWRDWKLWYHFQTEMPDPDPDNLVRLFDLRVDPREEIDVKDFYPWVISIMDGIVADYETSLEVHPRVPGGTDDPYVPPPKGSGSPVATYARTDRRALDPRSEALPNPNFSGSWSTAVVSSAPLTRLSSRRRVATLGSGWGNKISIKHTSDQLEIERVVFVPREIQPLVRYCFTLDGSETENALTMGRTGPAPTSTTAWDGDRLVITTLYPFQDPEDGRWLTSKVTQTVWLQPGMGTPWEPSLVVETTRGGALGGPPSTNRTVYRRGYR
ncbi:MAG: sulfatase-like hydrolase/transferase [Candidatus Aminicenantes bacterium]|nr:sulfatase-like hydrolase/transferase [Candidatus Aminicenantes bacterium]